MAASESRTRNTREREDEDYEEERDAKLRASGKVDKLAKLAAQLGVYSSDELAASGWARILITGSPKIGKTACTLLTAPRPILVLNCDMRDAPIAAQRLGAKFKAIDVSDIETWIDGVKYACAAVRAEKYRSVVIDTFTMLVNNILLLELREQAADNSYEAWRLLQTIALSQLNKLSQIDAHLFLIAHYDIDDGKLQVSGSLKSIIPALINDMAHLEHRPGKDPERVFKIGAQDGYRGGGRNVKKPAVIEADIELLLEELGLQP